MLQAIDLVKRHGDDQLALDNQGKAIFISTHDIFGAKAMADRVGIMQSRKLVLTRSREELREGDLEAIYLDYMQDAAESGSEDA